MTSGTIYRRSAFTNTPEGGTFLLATSVGEVPVTVRSQDGRP